MASRTRLMILLMVVGLLFGGGQVLASPPAQNDLTPVMLAARTDLESLANEVMGVSIRPVGWTNSLDPQRPSFLVELRLDLEILASALISPLQRPSDWFGAAPGSPELIIRDVRHDLELLADAQLGTDVRPGLWVGADPIVRCERDLQAMVTWLRRTNMAFTPAAAVPGQDYCAAAEQQANLFADILLPELPPEGNLRPDLNSLSRAVFRDNVYPAGWTDSQDAAGIRHDLDLLREAGRQRGDLVDPEKWFGAQTLGSDWLLERSNRHDLEVLADAKLGFNERPQGWTNFEPLVKCPYRVQNLVTLLQVYANVAANADPASPTYCDQVAATATQIVESGVGSEGIGGGLVNGVITGGAAQSQAAVGGIEASTTRPNAYLNHGATIRIGVIPRGTPFTALARSSAPDSRMMYVTGEGFTLWVAWPWTTLDEADYLTLPLAEQVRYQLPQLLCFAGFCNAIVHYGDPLGGEIGIDAGVYLPGYAGVPGPGAHLEQKDYSFVRMMIDRDDLEHYVADFHLEICADRDNIATCEPVLRLYEDGRLVPPIRVRDGYPVWQMTYRLHSTARLESARFFVNQLWVAHPHD